MNKSYWLLIRVLVTVILGLGLTGTCLASANTGYLEIIGVPPDALAGTYDTKTDIFNADLQHITGAFARITYDDLIIIGRVVEWRRKENYLRVTVDASLERENMTLIGEQIEYFSEEERLLAEGNLEVTTESAIIYADNMIFLEKLDRTDFFNNVVVKLTDAKMFGEHFVIYSDKDSMEFIGPFKGEFDR